MYIHGTYIVYYACKLHPVAGVAEEGRVPFPQIHQQSHRLDESYFLATARRIGGWNRE
jgi:hypothetical protein